MNPQPKLAEEQSVEADFIDDIAELLPTEQRPLWYRDMAHLRRLPADDEMLRIARAMGFLALVTRQTPAQIATERESLPRSWATASKQFSPLDKMQSLCISNSKNGWRNCQQKSPRASVPQL